MSFEEFEKEFDNYMEKYTHGYIRVDKAEKLVAYMAAYVLLENYNQKLEKELNKVFKNI